MRYRKLSVNFFIGVSIAIFGIVLLVHNVIQLSNHPLKKIATISAKPTLPVVHVWTKADSLAYAHDSVLANAEAQFICLGNLWGKESGWDARAHNPVRVMGKTAGGIPQLLGMSPLTPPTQQIDRGLAYVYYRFITPCKAWEHWKKKGWY